MAKKEVKIEKIKDKKLETELEQWFVSSSEGENVEKIEK